MFENQAVFKRGLKFGKKIQKHAKTNKWIRFVVVKQPLKFQIFDLLKAPNSKNIKIAFSDTIKVLKISSFC